MDYLVYAYLQLAQDKKGEQFERGDWKAVAELQVRPTKYLYADAITYFARAVGAARSGNPNAANADVAKLGELRDKLGASCRG